ncbi:uncharacterized protein At4g15545-like isoform X1 [Macadamia integrifolia]|uniref:uncharacterized protein At4g15545-like isoform X1 n=1 Tax=Macadamia integrifolia TaxID=60698 RepID=UPI001C4F6046|nr:uncharacterized protein At4g15545-like isoform X1 [Macadamia integrifolia]XP_042496763.1 uncharacterized protein At4g15545-like isoform X1 [Macadamia integrifolia]
MTQTSSDSGSGSSTDFLIPDEILSVIPTDPYDQLDLARKITSMAIASRVSNLETESGRLRQKILEKDRLIVELEEKVLRLEEAFRETDERLRIVLDGNVKLAKERDSLAMTARKMNRDLSKLETFKRQLIRSLSEDSSSQAEAVDIGTCDQSVANTYSLKDDGRTIGYLAPHVSGSTEMGKLNEDAIRYAGNKYSLSPYITPRLTPTGTPIMISSGCSPGGYSATGSPNMTSGTTSPTKSHLERRSTFSSWYPSSQQSSAASSPPNGCPLPARTTRIDGKEFFRQARSRLSYEQFRAFLANIKELNAHKQSREETLKKAEEIFGTDNKDLYLSFQGLLNRSTHQN